METIKKFKGSIEKNYQDYLKEPSMIGFTQDFPESNEVFDEIEVAALCRNFEVIFKVRYGKVTFGKNNEFDAFAITTDRVSISKHLPMGGFASNCHFSEIGVMERAVIDMAKKHDLMICKKVCSWPFAKAIVQENFYLPE